LAADDPQAQLQGALLAVSFAYYDGFPRAISILKPVLPSFSDDFGVCASLAFAAWVARDSEVCEWASKRCIALKPKNLAGYLNLGMLMIWRSRFGEACAALSAGIENCPVHGDQLRFWLGLAQRRMHGKNLIEFEFDGLGFVFELATFNTHSIESAAHFVAGTLTEPDELRFVRGWIGHCDVIVEVGAAVGNHTLYFAKALKPKKLLVFDADPAAVRQIEKNASLNRSSLGDTEIVVRNAAIGAGSGRQVIFDRECEIVALDDHVHAKVDFLKIDVDGMELQVLEGAKALIVRDRPKIMIEVCAAALEGFLAFVSEHGYSIVHQIVRPGDTNYFVAPGG